MMSPKEPTIAFVGVTCLACGSVHLVNPTTGKTVGENGK
jgi:hypothetical protein